MKFKSLSLKLIAASMTALLAFQQPLLSISANAAAKEVYISDLLISYAKSDSKEDIADAKRWLTDKGYTVVDSDLNQDADSWVVKSRPVFLGIKKTSDPDDAVTDLRLMHMNGDYSYDDYKSLLEDVEQETKLFIENAKTALVSYRENFGYVQDILKDYGKTYEQIAEVLEEHPDDFDEGCFRAMIAYENLNCFIDDDTGYPLGELLLEPIKEEMTSDDGGAHADLTTIMMQGNSSAVVTIMQDLAYTAETEVDSTWLDRAASAKSISQLMKEYEEAHPELPAGKLQMLLKADYDSDAGLFICGVQALREYVKNYESSGINLSSDTKDIDEYFETHEDKNCTTWLNAGIISEKLKEIRCNGTTLYELLCTDSFNFDVLGKRMELYPLLDCMTDAQRALMTYVPLDKQILIALTKGDKAWQEAYNNARSELEGLKPISVYAGVNRSMFQPNGGTALTRTALDHQTATKESYAAQFTNNPLLAAVNIVIVASAATFAVGLGCLYTSTKLVGGTQVDLFKNAITKVRYAKAVPQEVEFLNESFDSVGNMAAEGEFYEGVAQDMVTQEENLFYSTSRYGTVENASPWPRIWATVGKVVCIAAAVMLISAGVIAIIEMYRETHVDYKQIPKYIVHGVEQEQKDWDENTKWRYTYYTSVKCNRVDGGFLESNTKEMSDIGDLNGDIGKEWVALYATKDKAAGKPILANTVYVSAVDKGPVGSEALSYFGEVYAANLNNAQYVFGSNPAKRYIFFKHSEKSSAALTAAVTSPGVLILVSTLAALTGGLVCWFAVSRDGKKKREEAAA